MRFKPTSQRRASPALQFPQLRSITVSTTEALHSEEHLHVEARVGRLLGPRLQYLDIGSGDGGVVIFFPQQTTS